MSGHGHVTPNPDGSKVRCGGPAICSVCALEKARLPDELAELRAALAKEKERADRWEQYGKPNCRDDIETERDALRAECERLKAEAESWKRSWEVAEDVRVAAEDDCERARATLAEREAELALVKTENTRIVADAKQCHGVNDDLVHEHYALKAALREREAEIERLKAELAKKAHSEALGSSWGPNCHRGWYGDE
jgi:uncharacterized small protein (DUF1192 family)